MYKVKEVADLAGISVRTLHHYDQIGLLSPKKADNGYRYYSDNDFIRLQQILFFKELDFSLQRIKEILQDPAFDEKQALKQHKTILLEKKERLDKIIQSIDQSIRTFEGGKEMAHKDRFEPFDMKNIKEHQKKYAIEAEQRWGDTDAYQESARRTSSYTEEDWKKIHEESEEIDGQLVNLMDRSPADAEVQKWIEAKRQHITDHFYECNIEIFRGLADMYINDPRFTKNMNKKKQGYADFLNKAMHIYCDHHQ
ncbi:MerR family transcriptional regulator [Halobacillus andaensis]|uniref:MerR family transcriptional regulator n=1 Tax=Halobacillus andaensis TaxID=1176239 RepID=A0A917BBH2_HALAA|nr:MerR family transcriptional regulator [Halobacillus andaensis]MBP2006311.1 DNA-binding transcriptional MerR regulator [Halobacillus andaensis]GGF34177.1 MerR family transcriptional regulator [Halobacillus andaensis]